MTCPQLEKEPEPRTSLWLSVHSHSLFFPSVFIWPYTVFLGRCSCLKYKIIFLHWIIIPKTWVQYPTHITRPSKSSTVPCNSDYKVWVEPGRLATLHDSHFHPANVQGLKTELLCSYSSNFLFSQCLKISYTGISTWLLLILTAFCGGLKSSWYLRVLAIIISHNVKLAKYLKGLKVSIFSHR